MPQLLLLALLFALHALLPPSAHAAWNAEWKHRVKVSIDAAAGARLQGAVEGAPVLLRLHTGNFPFLDARPDGADLRFIAADDKTPLPFHVEKFDGVNELALVWVKLPRIDPAAKDAHVWLYYGNEKAAPAGNPAATYDAAQGLVYHFGDNNSALPQDSTANNNHALASTAKPSAAGLIGGGFAFDGNAELRIGLTPSLRAGAGGYTLAMWVKPETADDSALARQVEGAGGLALLMRGGRLVVQAGNAVGTSVAPLATGAWQHVALVVNDSIVLYVNGAEAGRVNAGLPPLAGTLAVGTGFKGEIDELQIASTARSADWVRLAAASQGPEPKLLTVAKPEGDAEAGSASYITILLNAVTLDGWIVIILLGVMFVVSFWVMISKALLVRRVARVNEQFMASFGQLIAGINPTQAKGEREARQQEAARRFGRSPLYRLYAAGVHELHDRFDAYRKSGRELQISAASLSAIKATVDARLVREMQALNSRLVVLTISIAGGPFLGLLGTVVGVMITFAAIAAAGDVNVNSIAPGIAAALVATVAGLAVAIPCLFGYNFLTTRIGELTADLQAFSDELVTRIAENHSA